MTERSVKDKIKESEMQIFLSFFLVNVVCCVII